MNLTNGAKPFPKAFWDFSKALNRVLLVEDYEANILVVSTLLEGFGYDYEVARIGIGALAKLEKVDFAIALMDIKMPDMDGIEITRRIREIEKKKGKPRMAIIAMTAHALYGDRERFLDADMDDYISKPFDIGNLEMKLRQHRNKFSYSDIEHIKNTRHGKELNKRINQRL